MVTIKSDRRGMLISAGKLHNDQSDNRINGGRVFPALGPRQPPAHSGDRRATVRARYRQTPTAAARRRNPWRGPQGILYSGTRPGERSR